MNGSPDLVIAGLKMIASLGLVLAIILALLYGVKRVARRPLGASGGRQIQVVESHYMGVKKSISLVRVPGKVLVLGICADRISLLETLDEDLVRPARCDNETHAFGPIFSERLKRLGSRLQGKDAS